MMKFGEANCVGIYVTFYSIEKLLIRFGYDKIFIQNAAVS